MRRGAVNWLIRNNGADHATTPTKALAMEVCRHDGLTTWIGPECGKNGRDGKGVFERLADGVEIVKKG